uniref:Uncharacterized protein n=1 Tax=Hucho hucho TaxID=62062 RepID=A0A4W5MKA1_9TELE
PDYFYYVLLEVQRLWPPFIGGRRIANQDTTLGGFHIPKGYAAVYISHAIHRDPEVFQQPKDFLPGRWGGRCCPLLQGMIHNGTWLGLHVCHSEWWFTSCSCLNSCDGLC